MAVSGLHDQPGASGVTVRLAVDRFLSSPRCANPNTRRAYASVLDRLAEDLGPDRSLGTVAGEELATALERLWGQAKPATWNRNRAAVASFIAWGRNSHAAPALPLAAERRADPADETKALTRPQIERVLTRRDIPLREKTLWRMLYETAAPHRRDPRPQRRGPRPGRPARSGAVQGWRHPVGVLGSGTAHLLPRLLRLPDGTVRTRGPLFLSERRPGPARRPAAKDLCPHLDADARRRAMAAQGARSQLGWAVLERRAPVFTQRVDPNFRRTRSAGGVRPTRGRDAEYWVS